MADRTCTSFAQALRHELEDHGVSVTALMPGPTETEFFERADLTDTKLGQAKVRPARPPPDALSPPEVWSIGTSFGGDMADRSPTTELAPVPTYGPLVGFLLRVRELCNTGRLRQALIEIDTYEWAADAFGDRTTVEHMIQRRMYTYYHLRQYEPALAVGEQLLARRRARGDVVGEAKTLADLAEMCIRIRTAVATADFGRLVPGMAVSISTGVAVFRAGMTGQDLFYAADRNLYRAKRSGRNRVAA